MKNKYNVTRKKYELLASFERCETMEDLKYFNNNILLPLFKRLRSTLNDRYEDQNFAPVQVNEFYFEDFNFLYDAERFFINLHSEVKAKTNFLHFEKYQFLAI